MRLLIAGSRTLSPTIAEIDQALARLRLENGIDGEAVSALISGTARGVDQAGEAWARAREIPVVRMPADWVKYGKSAGHLRNAEMAKLATHALVWWDGVSKGTAGMMKLLEERAIPHVHVRISVPT